VRLVDDLMEVSRITRGKIELRKEPVELADVMNAAIETSRPLIESLRHELTVTLPSRPLVVDADATRLAQVFSNLLNIPVFLYISFVLLIEGFVFQFPFLVILLYSYLSLLAYYLVIFSELL
jgi:hypothetical protein